jgi:hypothetical protein
MTVSAWGAVWEYKHFPAESLKDIPEEVREYALKGFIDDIQDATTSIKLIHYPKTPEGKAEYRADCLKKRRELEEHINAGTRPPRTNGTEAGENKRLATTTKSILAEGISLNGLMMKRMLTPEKFTDEEQGHLDRLMMEAVKKMTK